MNRSRNRRRFVLCCLLLALCSISVATAAKRDDARALRVEVVSRNDVADRQVDGLRSAILVALATTRCDVRLVRDGEKPGLVAKIELLKWRESQRPGGRNVFDPATGQTRRGVRREVEVRYRIEVLDPNGERLLEDEGQHVGGAQTRNNWLWDPHLQAVLGARRGAASQIERWICRAEERLARRERRSRRKARE